MKKLAFIFALAFSLLAGCGAQANGADANVNDNVNVKSNNSYIQISQQQAKEIMDKQPDAVVLDVREQHEYDEKHIVNAVLLPLGTINEENAAKTIPSKETVVLVYCRSGNRSKTASSLLAELGYTQVYEFGGIKDWQYDTE
ncbi:MAG: rhodanese-like domain-containing protein [Oscillospiraceae bacterium]|nr:rhodanese-like domain-containing protein [Oscillospiraceae bacterium]